MQILPTNRANSASGGFTLLELLIVIGLIGVLTFVAVPAFKGFGQSNLVAGAQRQLQDDLAIARQQAIKLRAPVYMVFLTTPANMDSNHFASLVQANHDRLVSMAQVGNSTVLESVLRTFTNAYLGYGAAYGFYTEQSVGDQPGVSRPRYLLIGQSGIWHFLPEGMVFSPGMQVRLNPALGVTNLPTRPVPFPVADLPAGLSPGEPAIIMERLTLPVVAFDSQGRLATLSSNGTLNPVGGLFDRFIGLSIGSVVLPRFQTGASRTAPGPVLFGRAPDLLETPRENYTNSLYRVAALTGRSRRQTWPVLQ